MRRQLIIGLPEAGKSTFLAALWALLNGSATDTCLRLRRLSGDRTRWETLADAWLAGEELGRTKLQDQGWAELELERRSDGRTFSLTLPDLSGEGFEAQWRDRVCEVPYLDAAREAEGVVLFVHATKIVKPISLTMVLAEARSLEGAVAQGRQAAESEGADLGSPIDPSRRDGETPPAEDQREWSADGSPTQLRLLDLLQILQRPPLGPRPRRLAVIVSAWDLVPRIDGVTPKHHLAEEMPLLDQYLRANDDLFTVKVFGVSPQGTDREAPDYEEVVSRLPEERILVDDGVARGYDLTSILDWASADVG